MYTIKEITYIANKALATVPGSTSAVWSDDRTTITVNGNKYDTAMLLEGSTGIAASDLELIASIKLIEGVFAAQMTALLKRSASTDGIRLRRATKEGMEAQAGAYSRYQSAVAMGLITEPLTDAQKAALILTVKFDALLIKVCDALTIKALNGEDWKTGFELASSINLEPADLTEEKLAELYTQFGIAQ